MTEVDTGIVEHGVRRYRIGRCRCQICRDAVTGSIREWRARRRASRAEELAGLDAMADQAIRAAGKRPWDERGRPKKNDDDALIEDIEWMLQDTRWLAEGIPHLVQVAARLDLSAGRLRKRLTEIGRRDILAMLSREDAA